jgi:DNA-binding transcriptional MerR regulator
MATGEVLRIGELSRRAGVSPALLRAWEQRYGLLRPTRSPGGLRLYSAADLERVRAMREHLGRGLAAAEAAALAGGSGDAAPAVTVDLDALRAELAAALDDFDEPGAQAILDRLLARMTLESVLAEIVLPYLRELGDRWARGEASIAQEHFASGLLRGRLLGLARGWGLGAGPLAVLACVPGEQHDLGLIAFGLLLRARGWRVVLLGPDAPLDTVQETASRLGARLAVLHAIGPDRLAPIAGDLERLAAALPVALAAGAAHGPGAPPAGVLLLTGDLVTEADRVVAEMR